MWKHGMHILAFAQPKAILKIYEIILITSGRHKFATRIIFKQNNVLSFSGWIRKFIIYKFQFKINLERLSCQFHHIYLKEPINLLKQSNMKMPRLFLTRL